jgi:hypothetical protein
MEQTPILPKVVAPEDRRLISGLSERLARAGVDPGQMIEDDALLNDVDHLRAGAPEPRRWWRPARRRSGRDEASAEGPDQS